MVNDSLTLLSVKETAEVLRCEAQTIRNRLSKNARNPFPIKPKRVGRRVFFRRGDVEAFLAAD